MIAHALLLSSLVAGVDGGEPSFHISDRVRVDVSERANASGCLVHLHGNEVIARAAMLDLAKSSCTNVLTINDAKTHAAWDVERIPVPMKDGGECHVNPNRVYTELGFNTRIELDCDDDPVARAELRRFVDTVLLPALARCRAEKLPVVAFHNNSNMTAGDMDAARVDARDPQSHDILFVTSDVDFAQLSALKHWTVAQQRSPPADDGSLSVLLQHEHYINVEAQIDPHNFKNNRAMGAAALHALGVDRCAPAPSSSSSSSSAAH